MLTGFITYECGVRGNRFCEVPEFEVRSCDPRVSKITVGAKLANTPENSTIDITTHFPSVESVAAARMIADPLVGGIANKMSFELKIGIVPPANGRGRFKDLDNGAHHLAVDSAAVSVRGIGPSVATRADDVIALKARIEGPPPPRVGLYDRFQKALLKENPVEKFGLLYGILLAKFPNDNFHDLDQWLNATFGDPLTKNTAKRPPETIYSKARHEMQHNRGVDLDQTVRDMEQRLDGLMERVKKAIETP